MSDTSLQGATRLADWGVLRAHGPDAASFLHGQLTQDIIGIDSGDARLAGYCSAKGRLLATMVVWRRGADELLLALSADLLAATLKRLSMFVLRAKCKLSDASAEVALYGVAGPLPGMAGAAWQRVEHGRAEWLRLPDAQGTVRHLWAAPADEPGPDMPALDGAAWARLEVASGVPRIVAATVEQFVPQMVNLELVGGVNFQKGCYPGQEVVARSQYRGTLKRRALLFAAGAEAHAGQEVWADGDDQPAGMVVNAAGGLALVELKLAARDAVLRPGKSDGEGPQADAAPLHPLALPYALPAEAA